MKEPYLSKQNTAGISLIEILVVITIFAVLGVIVSSSLILTIQGTKKSEALIRVRENVNYSLGVIERNIRNASSIVDCTNADTTKITYLNQNGVVSSFSCINAGGANSYIASGSARLTSDAISIVNCSFTCSASVDLSNPPLVTIDILARDAVSSGVQSSSVSAQTKIYLRN